MPDGYLKKQNKKIKKKKGAGGRGKVKNMRKFLIIERNGNKRIIHGIIESDMFPSTIQNDHEYSLKNYGVEYADVVEVTEHCHMDKIYEVEYMLGDEEKSDYVIADNESMASDVAYFLFGEAEDEPYKEIGIYDNSMYDFFVLAREDKYGNYQNMIFNTKEEALSKIGVDGWEKDDLKVYSDGLIMSLEEYEI